MSLYLGPIHYWLYHKIRILVEREQLLWEAAAQIDADMAEEGREMVWQTYGAPLPDEDLAELIDAGAQLTDTQYEDIRKLYTGLPGHLEQRLFDFARNAAGRTRSSWPT